VKADGNYTPYTSNPDALVNWDFIEQIVRKENCFIVSGSMFCCVCSDHVYAFVFLISAFSEFGNVVLSNLPVSTSCCKDDMLWPCLLLALYPTLFGSF
jgi:hypothetical protein